MVICKIFLKLYAIQENKIVMLPISTLLNKVKTFRWKEVDILFAWRTNNSEMQRKYFVI